MMHISIQGYQGSFHHIVATFLWGENIKLMERGSFQEVFDDVLKAKTTVGLVAVENTITGSIVETLDLLSLQPVTIVGEVILHIKQNLITLPGAKLENLRTVYSHPVALRQCLDFFKPYPHIKLVATDDTGGSVRKIVEENDITQGSVASILAAKLYGGRVLTKNIESNKENFTRFLIITHKDADKQAIIARSPQLAAEKKKNASLKVTTILHLPHRPGELAKCLNVIAVTGGNIMRIESRPLQGKPWEYTIHIDIAVATREIADKLISNLNPLVEINDVKGVYTPALMAES